MKISKKQWIIIAIVVAIVVWFFLRKKKAESVFTKEESSFDYDGKCSFDLNAYKSIGDNFFSLNSGICKKLAKKYIDGTIQQGIIIDSLGNARIGEEEYVTIPGSAAGSIKMRKLIPIPSDKGFKKNDGLGSYFYFEELPEWKKAEINKLEQQKIAAEKAEAEAKSISETTARNEALRLAREQKIAFEKAKRDAEINEKAKRDAEIKNEADAKQTADKNKKITIVVIVIVIAVAGYFVWKKYKK